MSYHNRIGRRVAPAGSYHRLSLADKQGLVRGADREPPMRCEFCGTLTTPGDLVAHVETRCQGPGESLEPQKHWKWVDWRHATVTLKVPPTTLSFWVRTGQVKFMGGRMDRKYLLRDLARKVSQRRGFRRR